MTTQVKSEFLKIMLERGFYNQCTNLEGLDELLCKEKVTAYTGFDPTGDSLHVGHLVPHMMMRWLQKCGHEAIILAGGVTGLIGDPSGKDESRKLITKEFVNNNAKAIAEDFYSFYGKDTVFVNNGDWLSDLNYIDFLRDYGVHFSINRMIAMDSVKTRLERESHLSFLEFNYMILQGYDFLHLSREKKCRLQISGADQWGNVVQGVELARRIDDIELFGFTAPLITMANGKKMGKTEKGAVWLSPKKLSHYDFYQYFRNTQDADVGKFLRIFTEMPIAEINKLESLKGSEINEAKKILAFEVTKIVRGLDAATEAAATAQKTFEEGVATDGLPTIEVSQAELDAGIAVSELFKQTGLVESNGEMKRLVAGGGAKVNDEKVEADTVINSSYLLDNGTIKLSSGKKKHALVKVA